MKLTLPPSVLSAALLLSLAATSASAQSTRPAPSLTLGSPAPALKIGKWFKGEPVPEFQKGHVYVVELWATWCGPCKASMPHVSELARKYKGKATIIGVSIWEKPKEPTDASLHAIIQTTIDQMGDKMDYTVAAEGLDKGMAITWMQPAGRETIPCAFIIDKDSKIAWIGLPSQMDSALDAVVNNTFSIPDETERRRVAAAEDAVKNKYINAVLAARQASDAPGVLKALDNATANNALPDHPDMVSIRLDALLATDPAAAVTYIESLASPTGKLTTKPVWVLAVLRVLPLDNNNAKSLSRDQYKTLEACLEPSTKASPLRINLAYYAALAAKAGDYAKAATYQQQAITLAEASPNKAQLTDWLETQKAKLATYQTSSAN